MREWGRLLLALVVVMISYLAIVLATSKTENIVCHGTYKRQQGKDVITSTSAVLGIQIEKLSWLAFWVDDENDKRASLELLEDVSDPQTRRQYTLVNVGHISDLYIEISDKRSSTGPNDGMMTYYSNRSDWVSFVDRSPSSEGQDDTIVSFGGPCERRKPLFS